MAVRLEPSIYKVLPVAQSIQAPQLVPQVVLVHLYQLVLVLVALSILVVQPLQLVDKVALSPYKQLPVVEAHCEYWASARYDDDLEIRTTGTLLSPVRLRFDDQVVRVGDQAAALAAGHTVHATLDASGRPRRLPDRVRTVLGV